jgi:hypothetical protein
MSALSSITSALTPTADVIEACARLPKLTPSRLSWCWTPSRCHQTNFEHDGEFFRHLLVLSSIASRSIIVGNQEESFRLSWINFRIGIGQSIDQIFRVGNQFRCGQCVSSRTFGLGPPVVCWWPPV